MSKNYLPNRGNYNDLKPFKFWCQKVLPLVYDDSLSYYELLDKVVDYLNKTMEDVTTLNDDVTAMYGAYEQLQNYVNSYFDNLDVQDEINSKLDQMAIDGSLSALINPQIPGAVSSWLAANVDPVGSAVVVDSTLTISGAAADAKVTGDNFNNLKEDLNYANSKSDIRHEQVLSYIQDIADINLEYTAYDKNSPGMTVEIGKKITTGVISSNSSYSYIAYTIPNDGYLYCYASPTDSAAYLYSGEPLGSETIIKMGSKPAGTFPTINSPWEVKAGQIIAVSAKTTNATQLIYLADFGSAISKSEIKIENLENGKYPIIQKASFTIGRWGPDGTHTSTICVRNSNSTIFDHDTVAICEQGYKFYNIIEYSENSWSIVVARVCTYHFKANTQYRININKIDESAITNPNDVASHVMLYDLITSDYNKFKDTFFGFEMYNKVAFVGDSYTMKRATYNKCWGQIIGQKCGIEVNLFGHSGYTTNTFRNATGSGNSLTGMLAAPANDLYWLGFGINDAAGAKQNPDYVGSAEDLSGNYTEYPNTFWGNYGCIIESIQTTFPNAKIVLCNVMYHDMLTMQVGSNTVNIPIINSALNGIAIHYGIPLINLMDDIFYKSPEYDNNMQATAYTHPDPILFPGMANANMRLFAKAVSENPAYFKTST